MLIPQTLWNLLKKLGREPEKMKWCYVFGYLAATDITEEEEKVMRSTVEWSNGKKIEPLKGYIIENKKGAYFIPVGDGMIMKIDCKRPEPKMDLSSVENYTLTPGYRGVPK